MGWRVREAAGAIAALAVADHVPVINHNRGFRVRGPVPIEVWTSAVSPWYLEAWSLALLVCVAVAGLYGAHRVRVAFLLRMERQRVRIAMDLHDEVGSGLGSIGLLASLAADGQVDEIKRKQLAAEIAEIAGEIGATLGDLVWSLRVKGGTLESLAYYLAERAGRFFPNGSPSFATDFPDRWPLVRLSPAVRQNVLLVALEALHNAARHAGATRVVLGMKQVGRRWRLSVADDGIGLPGNLETVEFQGNGLASMQARAESIGASITFLKNGPGGTTMEVIFDPQARERSSSIKHVAASI